MREIVRKLFIDFEKEEKWLNEMSSKGLQFVNYTIGKYVFEHGQKGQYIYRIELLDNEPTHPESKAYIEFMEESGIQQVGSYYNWVYFRKKAEDGAFDLYTDYDSKINHYKRIAKLLVPVLILNLIVGFINVFYGFLGDILNLVDHYYGMERPIFYPSIFIGSVNLLLSIFIVVVSCKYIKQIRRLKKEKQIYG